MEKYFLKILRYTQFIVSSIVSQNLDGKTFPSLSGITAVLRADPGHTADFS